MFRNGNLTWKSFPSLGIKLSVQLNSTVFSHKSFSGPSDFHDNDFKEATLHDEVIIDKRAIIVPLKDEADTVPHVLMVFLTSRGSEFQRFKGSAVQFNRTIWTTIFPEMKQFCTSYEGPNKDIRMLQYLGN
jgi:hypothetical protein